MRQRPTKQVVPTEAAPAVSPPATETAIAAPLPGARRVVPALLDEAVDEINRITTATGLAHARGVAEVVVRVFGGGDLDAFRSGATEHATWRALADRDDLAVSHSFLWISVAVLDQLRKLPEDIGNALPVSHHRRLLGVKDDEVKLALATKAVEEEMTVKELEAAVAAVQPEDKPNPGRKPLPAFAKAIRGLPRLFEGVKPTDVTVRALAALGVAEIEHLIAILDAQLAGLSALRAALQKGLDAER